MSQAGKSNLVKANNANVTHFGAVPNTPYCHDDSQITSYAMCLNKPTDYPKDDRRSFCSICPCGKDALKGAPPQAKSACGSKTANCPNLMYTANGSVVKTN